MEKHKVVKIEGFRFVATIVLLTIVGVFFTIGAITTVSYFVLKPTTIVREFKAGKETHFIDSKDRYGKIFEINPLARRK